MFTLERFSGTSRQISHVCPAILGLFESHALRSSQLCSLHVFAGLHSGSQYARICLRQHLRTSCIDILPHLCPATRCVLQVCLRAGLDKTSKELALSVFFQFSLNRFCRRLLLKMSERSSCLMWDSALVFCL